MAFLKEILPIAASMAAGVATGGSSLAAQAAAGALAGAGSSLATGGDSDEALTAGLGGAAGGALGGAMSGAESGLASAPGQVGATPGGVPITDMTQIPNTAVTPNPMVPPTGAGNYSPMTQQVGAPNAPINQGLGTQQPVGVQPDPTQQAWRGGDTAPNPLDTPAGGGPDLGAWRGNAQTPPVEQTADQWIADNQGKALLGLGGTSMALNEYHTEKDEDKRHKARKEAEADWQGRKDWYQSQSGPVNAMDDYEKRNR